MNKISLFVATALAGVFGWAGIAAATTPVVDAEAEATSLFNEHAPTVVAVVLAVAGFTITMAVLGSAISRVRSALNGR